MKNQFSDDSDHNLWVFLHQIRDLIFRAREKELRQYGITPVHAGVLLILTILGGKSSPSEIARWMVRKPHTISGFLSRMEKAGLVKKEYKPGDKGRITVTITPKGKRIFVDTTKRESIRNIFSCLSEKEHQQLHSILEKLRKSALSELHSIEGLPFP
ncbi:MAG: winged helix-turn-helix transcriptional regulator [Dehalococcoidia bacterium]|nr:MAG: winged helix-turn-helix transcriptional regulator [Dehalococcoidia bacterium]